MSEVKNNQEEERVEEEHDEVVNNAEEKENLESSNENSKLFSRIRFLPVGPIVTLTASASFLIPFLILRLASSSNKSCFAAIIYLLNLINQF